MAGHVEKGVGKQSLPQQRKTEPRSSNPNPVSFLYPSLPECLDLINISLDEMDCFLSANIFFYIDTEITVFRPTLYSPTLPSRRKLVSYFLRT